MSKFDFSDLVKEVRASLKKDPKKAKQIGVGNELKGYSKDPADFVVMPDWWLESYGILGLRFGTITQIAGKPDSGKTSIAITAMKAAQDQGYGVIYVETENKTTEDDLMAWGVDPKGVIIVKTAITEEAFDNSFKVWDNFFRKYPDQKLLYLYDSYGNTVSQNDAEIDMTEKSGKVGGNSKVNRLGINRMIAKMQEDPVAVLFVNYTYANMGSVGRTNAGGEALQFFSSLTIQTARKSWIEATKNGKRVRKGATVVWNTYKNHYSKNLKDEEGNPILLPSKIELNITSEGMKLASGNSSGADE